MVKILKIVPPPFKLHYVRSILEDTRIKAAFLRSSLTRTISVHIDFIKNMFTWGNLSKFFPSQIVKIVWKALMPSSCPACSTVPVQVGQAGAVTGAGGSLAGGVSGAGGSDCLNSTVQGTVCR